MLNERVIIVFCLYLISCLCKERKMKNKNYWGYRVDKKNISFFKEELEQGRLRIGWGWLEGQDLKNLTVDAGAAKNLLILNRVKKGDVLLVPHLPEFTKVTVAEATEDFNSGYRFAIAKEFGDYGHIFPAKFIKSFDQEKDIPQELHVILKNLSRFWNLNHYCYEIEGLLGNKIIRKRNKDNSDLMIAIEQEDLVLVEELLKKGIPVNTSEKNFVPLVMAVETENIPMIELLLKWQADVNAQTNYNYTALLSAVEKENLTIARLLLKSGAGIHIQNKDGLSAFLLAWQKKRNGVNNEIFSLFVHDAPDQMPFLRM